MPAVFTAEPIPDLRPEAVRWHRPPEPAVWMLPLPLASDAPLLTRDLASPGSGDHALEALRAHAGSMMTALVDAIQGRRPTAQLTRWVSEQVMADITVRAQSHRAAVPIRWAVRSVRVQVVQDDAAEVSARLQCGDRFAAAALRLERRGGRWLCRVADFGPMPDSLIRSGGRGTS